MLLDAAAKLWSHQRAWPKKDATKGKGDRVEAKELKLENGRLCVKALMAGASN